MTSPDTPSAAHMSRNPTASSPVQDAPRSAPPVPPATPWSNGVGRIPIVSVEPVVDGGRFPAKAVVSEDVPVVVTAFREGHAAMGVEAVLSRPDGTEHSRVRLDCTNPGLDLWEGRIAPDAVGDWSFRIEAFSDVYATWAHDAAIKVEAGIDLDLVFTEGVQVLERALEQPDRDPAQHPALAAAVDVLRNRALTPSERLAAATTGTVPELFQRFPLAEYVTATPEFPLMVERERALYGSWYEFFPRSIGARFDPASGGWVSGTLRTAAAHLPDIAAMGFDVAYITPVSPIGHTFRKGRNNTLDPEEGDPGSPYAIGSQEGGHEAIHPDLGTEQDFRDFTAAARECGLEVALDLALQCSPDHPWVTAHPEWFTTRVDGSIAYAENPPKKYQDIYPLNFDNDPEGIYAAIRDLLEVWMDRGVTIFRVDNPHTKPVAFWQRLLAEFHRTHPEVIFLAEAFTRPAMMHTLAKVGFQQSYTYFAWRTSPEEFEEYLGELTSPATTYMRPAFWPATHDILTPFMQQGRDAFRLRAVLAATLSPTWGIYSGYELAEHEPRPGVEEQIDNEKYEYKPRDFAGALARGESLAPLLTRLNEIRRSEFAFHRLRNITFHEAEDPDVLVFSKRTPGRFTPDGRDSTVLVICMTRATGGAGGRLHLHRESLGVPPGGDFEVEDLLSGERYRFSDDPLILLAADSRPAHILRIIHPETH